MIKLSEEKLLSRQVGIDRLFEFSCAFFTESAKMLVETSSWNEIKSRERSLCCAVFTVYFVAMELSSCSLGMAEGEENCRLAESAYARGPGPFPVFTGAKPPSGPS